MGTLRTGINDSPGITTDWRSLTVAKITAVNYPTSGPFNGRPVYSWLEQTFNPATGAFADSPTPRKGSYTDATNFSNILLDLNDAALAVDSYVWCRLKGQVYGTTVYECDSGGSGRSYIVKLTAQGAGIDGGTAWAGRIQEEVSGTITDNGYIGATHDTPTYVMYKTKSYDGSPGVPEVGDIVIAIPDPTRPGVWEFIPKMVAGADCEDCCWFVDMDLNSCVTIQQLGGDGRCASVPSSGEIDAVYMADLEGWLALEMGTTACGCGGTIFKPILQDIPSGPCDATISLRSYHISCAAGSGSGEEILDATMFLSCCGRDQETGQPFAIFVGWGVGPCEDVAKTGCDNTFRIKVQCAPCPDPPCVCTECQTCCEGSGPFGYYALLTLFTDQKQNGFWIWNAVLDEDCTWRATCGEGSAAYISELTAVNQMDGTTLWTLDHAGSTYEADNIVDCCASLLLTKTGGDGPATVELQPITLNGECPDCVFVWPETLTFTVTDIILTGGATIGLNIGDEFTLSKLDPAPGDPWDTTVGWGYNYTSPVPGTPSFRFRCVDQTASCRGFTLQGEDGDATFSFCLGVGGAVTPCADSPPDSVSTLVSCSCSPVFFEGTDYEKCVAGTPDCPYGPADSTVTITGTVTE